MPIIDATDAIFELKLEFSEVSGARDTEALYIFGILNATMIAMIPKVKHVIVIFFQSSAMILNNLKIFILYSFIFFRKVLYLLKLAIVAIIVAILATLVPMVAISAIEAFFFSLLGTTISQPG
jgi:hypothetical protein